MNLEQLQLCLVTNIPQAPFYHYKNFIKQAIDAGVTAVQLRAKDVSHKTLLNMAHELQEILVPANVPLIINDKVDIAKAVNAKGVHIGQTDEAPLRARECLGPDKWIGLSIETNLELEQANQLSCIDYVAASAVFPTDSKTNCRTYWGLTGLKQIVERSTHPVVAIGGINLYNIHDVMASGVVGVAVISAIHAALNPSQTTHALMHAIRGEHSC